MIRDPFYRDIVSGLQSRVEPETFERCAAALLRPIYPGLVPVRGGSDAGMDGAIADGEGTPFQLITTTSNDVIRNLRRSLRSYAAEGGERQKAVLATSVQLTPKRRRNLTRAAAEQGVTLVQIHDQAAFADLLYRAPEWCRELLDLTGQPPALSAVPLTSRPVLTGSTVGREQDLDWICSTSGDCLLVGQPGAGKTFVLRALVERGEGLFAISDDPGRIAESLRAQAPRAIFVDDAHLRRDLLVRLVQLRADLRSEFRIVATGWPGEKDDVRQALGIPNSAVRTLEPLTRREIGEVIRGAGIYGPPRLIRELIHQSRGRPGLAVTLCHLCLRDGTRDIANGSSLFEDVRHSFSHLVGAHAIPILASLSVGGDRGLQMGDVSNTLGVPLLSLHDAVKRLAAGGVLMEHPDRSLAVQPEALRHALIGAVFYGGAGSLPIEPLIAHVQHACETAVSLIGARGRGAGVPDTLIRGLLERCPDVRPWQLYASLGAVESRWVVEQRPELLIELSWIALQTIPEVVIPRMLAAAVGNDRPLHATVDHPLRMLQDWVQSAVPGGGEVISRREAILKSAGSWHATGDANPGVCLQAIRIAFTPGFEEHGSDPVDEMIMTSIAGPLRLEEVDGVIALWPRAVPLLRAIGLSEWGAVQDLIRDWVYPGLSTRGRVESETGERMQQFARTVASSVLEIAGDQPGVRLWIRRLAENRRWQFEIATDPVLEVLFPERPQGDFEATHQRQAAAASALAHEWAQDPPDAVAERLVRYTRDAAFAGLDWPVWTGHVARCIAENTADPVPWLRAMMGAATAYDVLRPFLERTLHDAHPGWEKLWMECYNLAAYRPTAILLALTESSTTESILDCALRDLTGMAAAVGTECLRRRIKDDRVLRLLRHPDPDIAAEVAGAVWHANAEGGIPAVLQDAWRSAVILHQETKHTLAAIFNVDASIAFEWLVRRVGGGRIHEYEPYEHQAFSDAFEVLTREQRVHLLEHLSRDTWPREIVRDLVGWDPDVYAELLSRQALTRLHLEPLVGNPDDRWIPLAIVALDAGYTASEVAGAVRGLAWGWEGSEAAMWDTWADRFRPLAGHSEPRVRQVGMAGLEHAEHQRDELQKRERAEAI